MGVRVRLQRGGRRNCGEALFDRGLSRRGSAAGEVAAIVRTAAPAKAGCRNGRAGVSWERSNITVAVGVVASEEGAV